MESGGVLGSEIHAVYQDLGLNESSKTKWTFIHPACAPR